jgi:hypothetical protein
MYGYHCKEKTRTEEACQQGTANIWVVAEGSGGWRKLLTEKLHSPQIVRLISWAGYLAHISPL